MEKYSIHKQSVAQNQFKKYSLRPLSGLVLMGLLASTAQAGKITSVPSASGAEGFGGWNEGNIEVIVNGTGSWYDKTDGAYNFTADSDGSYIANVKDDTGEITGIALAKGWPVGEPPGIKIINDDMAVKAPKPENCIIGTSYLADHYLDSDDPQQVLCSGPFQSHKRYKLAMLPSGFDGIDLVFNVEAEAGSRTYQVFQKINNWTNGRLEGFTVQIGTGVGANFNTASAAGIALADLNISVPTEIWPEDKAVAVFSAGLFGPLDKHTGNVGFFDPTTRAGFLINEHVDNASLTDTLTADTTLGSDYNEVPAGATNQFGPWIADNMLPYGIFFDDDGNPETDAQLLAWYGWNPNLSTPGLGWMGGSEDEFAEVTEAQINEMGENLAFTMGEIDDLVNVGLDYVITIGDVATFNSSTITIRVTPTADTSGTPAPPYVGEDGPVTPVPELTFTSSDAAVLLDPNPEFVVGSLLTARVGDADLNADPLVIEEVVVAITNGTTSGTLTLIEQGENRGVFVASLPEEYSNVEIETVVTMTYIDADNGNGNGVEVTKTSSTTAIAEPPPILSDVTITDFSVPDSVLDGQSRTLKLSIANDKNALEAATGSVRVTGTDGSELTVEFTDLRAGGKLKFDFAWTAALVDPTIAETVEWAATVIINDQSVDDTSAATLIEVKKGNN